MQRGDHRLSPTNFAKEGPQDTTNEFCKISEIALNFFKRSKNCWKPFLWSKHCLSTHKNLYKNFNFFVKCKGGTTGYHQRILQRGDHRIPPTSFFKISEIAFNCFKRSKNCWKPFLWSKQCLSTRKNLYKNFNFFCQVQRGDHRISPTNFFKILKIALNCFKRSKNYWAMHVYWQRKMTWLAHRNIGMGLGLIPKASYVSIIVVYVSPALPRHSGSPRILRSRWKATNTSGNDVKP